MNALVSPDTPGEESPTKFKMQSINADPNSIDAPPAPPVRADINNNCCKDHPTEEVLYWEFGPVEVKCQTKAYEMICYKCKQTGVTEVSEGPSKLSWIMCLILCALGFVCCCLLPILPCAKKWGFRDYKHVCPNCRALVSLKRHDIRSRYKVNSDDPNDRKWEQIKGRVTFDKLGNPVSTDAHLFSDGDDDEEEPPEDDSD